MKTNVRKFLSLFLSLLMVFGSFATMLPTTVMAAEINTTTDGSTIDCIIIDAADIAAAGNPTDVTGIGTTIGKVVNGGLVNGMARFVSTGVGAASSANDRLVIKTGDVLFSDYPYVVMAYKTNISATNMNFNFATAEGEYPGSETKLFGSQTRTVGELAIAKYSWPGTYGENTKLAGIYVPIYSNTGATVADGDYMDVQYVGLFKSADDAAKFDYAAYAQRTVTVTSEDGTEVLGTFSGAIGETVNPLEAINLPYANKDGAFATLADDEGNAYSASELVITDDLTLKVEYVPIGGFVDANYIKTSGTTVWVNGSNLLSSSVLETINGSEYLTMTIETTGGSHNFSAMYPAPHKTADFKYIAVDAIMDIDITATNGRATFIRPVQSTNGKDYYGTKVFENADYSSRTFDGTAYNKQLVFEIPAGYTSEYVYGVDIAPWNGQSTDAGAYFKVRYVASFPSGEAAQAFDYDAYVNSLENDLYVTLENPAGEVISSTYVANGGEFTFPGYTPVGDAVFVGWKDANGNTYQEGAEITVTESITFTAIANEPVSVTLLGTDGETELATESIVPGQVVDLSDIAGIPYKDENGKFLTWVNGTTVYSDTYTVDGAITLTAKYADIKVYHAADIYSVSGSGAGHLTNIGQNRKLVADPDTGITYFQIFPDETANPQTATPATYLTWNLEDTTWGTTTYPYFMMGYKSNITTASANTNFFQMTVYGSATLFSKGGNVNQNTASAQKLIVDASSWNTTAFTSFRLMPWGAKNGGNDIGMIADEHFDISYIAFATTEADANAFEYDKYLTAKLTLKGENGEEDTVVPVIIGQSYTLPGGYTQNGATITRVGWEDENGTPYAGTITITGDLVLTPANATATAIVFAAGDNSLKVTARNNRFVISGKTTDNGVDYYRFTKGTAATSVAAAQAIFDYSAKTVAYNTYDHMVWYYRTNLTNIASNWTLSHSGSSAAEGTYDSGTGWSGADNLSAKYSWNTTGSWAKKVLNPTHATINNMDNFVATRLNPWGSSYAWSDSDYFDISYVAFLPDEEFALAFDIGAYLDSLKTEVTVYGYGSEEPVVVKVNAGSTIPVDGIATQYVEDGQLMVISGWEVDGETYPVDTYLVNSAVTATAVYAPANILAEADGTLVGKSQNTATFNSPVASVENGVYYEHYTANAGVTVAQSQAQFADDSNTKLYAEVPYVAYSYRTNITPPNGYWYTAYTVKNWGSVPMEDNPNTDAVETNYYGTAVFQQKVNGIIPDGEWHVAVHKPEKFGDYPNEDRYADASMYLTSSRLAPWQTTANIEITGDEYLDVEYIGYFPSEAAANNFDFDAYLNSLKVDVVVEIDGVVNDALSGKYIPGSAIELPAIDNDLFVGYVQDGAVVTAATAAEGTVAITTLYKHAVDAANYIVDRGNLANLKGDALTVVYLGGSVTAGSGASSDATNWAGRTTQTLKDMGYTVTAYNEGIGGTGSRLGSFRVAGDVIGHNPDLVFIDFAINDAYCGEYADGVYNGKYYEYIIREIRKALPNTEIVSVFTTDATRVKAGGLNLAFDPIADAQDEIAANYDVTSIDVGKYAAEAIFGADGAFDATTWGYYYTDGVHPSDYGYALYAEVIASYLAGIDTADGAAAHTLPAEAVYEAALAYNPVVIDFADLTYSEDEWTLADHNWSTTFNKHLAPVDYTAESQTVSFTFTGTELSIYYSSPKNADSTIAVTVDGETVTVGGRDSTNGPKVFFEGLDNVEHEVTVVQSGVTGVGYIVGILAGGEQKTYTIDLTASVGGQVECDGVTAAKHTINAYEGQVLTFTAVPSVEDNTKLRNWHDLTSGQIVVLTDNNGIPYEDDNAPLTINYTVKGNAVINANFVSAALVSRVRLVAFIGRGNYGYITVGESDTPTTYFSEYMGGNTATTLKAVAYDGYTAAYWVRFTQDSLTQVLLATGDTVEAYPLGGSVYYQPVFVEAGTPVEIYINKATREIITDPTGYDTVINTTYSKDGLTVYDCTKSVVADEGNLLEVYDKNGSIVKEAKNPAYASEWIITTANDGMKWTMSINDGEAFDVSYDKEFRFNYMFTDKTKVVITETPVTGTENTDYVIETLASWTANGITNFTGLFDLAEGLTLVQHGVMMSQSADDLTALANNETGIIEVADGTIVGKVNATVTTSLYTVSKRLANAEDDWYGRAYLIYKNGETTYLVYAEDTIPVPAV